MDIFALTEPADPDAEPGDDTLPAGIARRLAALCYDTLLLVGVLAILTLLVVLLRGGRAIEPGTPWFTLGLFVVIAAFFAWFWTHGGQTLGMTAWRLELRSATGGPVTLTQALIRFTTAWLSLGALGLGFVAGALDRRKRTWHDRLAGTVVVRRAAARPERSAQTHERNEADCGEDARWRPGDE